MVCTEIPWRVRLGGTCSFAVCPGFLFLAVLVGNILIAFTFITHAKHYDSISVHFNAFYDVKNVNFQMKNSDILFFLIFARGIDCGQFLRSVFWGGNKKIMYAPCKTPV